jgi:hypothetical protein
VNVFKTYQEENISRKECVPDIPETGMAVLQQQYQLVQTIETWIASLKEKPALI